MSTVATSSARLTSWLAVAGLCFLTAAAAFAQAAPDAFYLALLRDGKAEMLRGDAVAAKKSFRLAAFGFLEHPVLLAEGLVRLGLAESALNDQEEFVATFSRLAEVEERFAAYAPAALSADERRAFEERALEWVTPEVLRSLPSFAPLLARKSEVDFAKLSPRERTRELEKRSAAEPGNPQWKLMLAQDEAAGEHWAKALGRLDGIPDGTGQGAAGCLRGEALAGLKRCDEALAPLAACAAVSSDAGLAEARLTCLLALDRADAARAFAAQLVRPAAEAAAVRKAVARIPDVSAAAPEKERPAPVKVTPGKEKKRPVIEDVDAPAPTAPISGSNSPTAKPAPPKGAAADEKKGPVQEKVAPPPAPPASSAATSSTPVSAPPSATPSAAPKSAGPRLTPDEERKVADARSMLKTVENRDELRRGFAAFRPVADRLAERADLQLLAGEIAYRAGLWTTGADYFKRSTPGGRGPTDPTLRFYYAVCLYEAGSYAEAAEVASTGLEKLQSLPFVEVYLQKIRAARP